MTLSTPSAAVRRQLALLTFGRFVLTTGARMVYPFLPALARGLHVSLTDMANLLALRALIGIPASGLGTLSERFGRKPLILAGLLLFAAGNLLVLVSPTYWALGVTLCLGLLAKLTYDPVMHAYVSDRVPYTWRGRALALTETSWAGALLVGIPLIGFAISRYGWTAPFGALAALSALAAVGIGALLPGGRGQRAHESSWRGNLTLLRHYPQVWAAAGYALALMISSEMFFVAYGDWLESRFQLSLSSLGLASAVIGGAELIGEVGAGWVSDALGKRRTTLLTALSAAVGYAAIPYLDRSVGVALLGMFCLFLSAEMAFVSLLPIFTELIPQARTVALAALALALGVGRATGAWLAPILLARQGFSGNGWVSAGVVVAGVLVLWRWVPELSGVSAESHPPSPHQP